ncbi:MAG: response regulator [Saprospiraceae bacterium]|nr:response regulator [Saprospiraceae bacterium]
MILPDNYSSDQPLAINITSQMLYYESKQPGKVIFDSLKTNSQNFKPLKSFLESDTIAESYWTKFVIRGISQPTKLYLGTNSPVTHYFIYQDDNLVQSDKVGTHLPNRSPLFDIVANPFVPVNLAAGLEFQVYMKRERPRLGMWGNNQTWRLNNVLLNKLSILQFQLRKLYEILPVVFILLTVFIYHLVLYFGSQEKNYLYLGLASLASLLLVCSDNDLIVQTFSISNTGHFNDYFVLLFYAFTTIMAPFTLSYLKISISSFPGKAIYRYYLFYLVFWSCCFILQIANKDLFHSMSKTIIWIGYRIMLIGNILLLGAGILSLQKRETNALYFVAGFGTVFIGYIGTIFFSLNYIYIANHNLPTAVGYILLSFGLARQIKTLQDGRSNAEKQKALSEQLREVEMNEKEKLKQLDYFKTKLYTNITHEFRTPLTVISGIADQIRNQPEEKALIQRNSQQLLDLVNQMLELNKIDSGQMKPLWVHSDIIPLIRYLAESYIHLAKSKNIGFNLQLLEESIWMDNDPYMIERILNNLISNAIKFTPVNGVINLRVAKDSSQENCLISIQDSGKGIAPDQIDHIFDRFYQVDNSTTRHGEGTGIGLALVQELVEIMKGQISVQSTINQGSLFTISMRILQQAEIVNWTPETGKSQIENFIESSSSLDRADNEIPKVLLIEDHSDVRYYLSKLLTAHFELMEADNGKSGLSLAFDEIPDLIISDIMMPQMDGFSLCQHIKNDKRTSHIPVILLTAKSTQDDRLKGLEEGADAYLTKPFDKRELLIRIDKLLESRNKLRIYYQRFQMLPQEKVQENSFLEKIRMHIEENFSNEHYQIEDLASSINLSRTQVYRKLKALTGKSFTDIVKEMKIHQAKELLSKTEKSVSEIAYELGFKDASYFSKVFKEIEGRTPSQFKA